MSRAFVTLTASLQNLSGVNATTGAKMRLTLCGFGSSQPVLADTSEIAEVFMDLPYAGADLSTTLIPNDYITPNATFYCIQVFDWKGNCISAQNYLILSTAGANQNLASLSPYFPPPFPIPTPPPPPPSSAYTLTDLATGMNWTLYVAFDVLGYMPAAAGVVGVSAITLTDTVTSNLISLTMTNGTLEYGSAAAGAVGLPSLSFTDSGNGKTVTVTMANDVIAYSEA